MIRALLKSESVPSRNAAKTSPLRFLRQVSLLLPYLPVVWEWFFSFTFYQLARIPLIPLAAPSLLSPLHPHHPITVRTELCISQLGPLSITGIRGLLAQAPVHAHHAYELSPCTFLTKTGKSFFNAFLSYPGGLVLCCCP